MRYLIVVLLGCCAHLSLAQTTFKLQFDSTNVTLIEPELGDPGAAYVSKFNDLNSDGLEDVIINLGNCGNWGDCEYGIFKTNGDGTYQLIWGPEYLLDFQIIESDKNEWKSIVLMERIDEPDPKVIPSDTLVYSGTRYSNN